MFSCLPNAFSYISCCVSGLFRRTLPFECASRNLVRLPIHCIVCSLLVPPRVFSYVPPCIPCAFSARFVASPVRSVMRSLCVVLNATPFALSWVPFVCFLLCSSSMCLLACYTARFFVILLVLSPPCDLRVLPFASHTFRYAQHCAFADGSLWVPAYVSLAFAVISALR